MSFVPRTDILAYQSTVPIILEVPINLDFKPNIIHDINAQCTLNNNSYECRLENELQLIKSHLLTQISIAQNSFLQRDEKKFYRRPRGIALLGKFFNLCCSLITESMFDKSLHNEEDINTNLNRVLNFSKQNSRNADKLKEHFDNFSLQVKNISDRVNLNLFKLQEQILNITLFPDLTKNLFAEIGSLWQTILINTQTNNLREVKNYCRSKRLSKEIIPTELLREELIPINTHLITNSFELAINPDTT